MNKPEFYTCHSIIEKDGIYYEITHVNAPSQSYKTIDMPGAANALGKTTNKGAICITEGKVGYIKKLNSDESAFMAAFGNYNLFKLP